MALLPPPWSSTGMPTDARQSNLLYSGIGQFNAGLRSGSVVQKIPLNAFRAPAAWKDALGDTATAAILGLADTPGSPLLSTAASGNTVTQSAVVAVALPDTYVPGGTVTVRIRAKQATTLLTVGTTVDLVAKLVGDTVGSDICTTAAQTLSIAYANYDFTVTPTGLVAGDVLLLDCFLALNDTGGTVNTAASITAVSIILGTS